MPTIEYGTQAEDQVTGPGGNDFQDQGQELPTAIVDTAPISELAMNDKQEPDYNPFDNMVEYTPQGFEVAAKIAEKQKVMDDISKQRVGILDSIAIGVGKTVMGVGQSIKQGLLQTSEDLGLVKPGTLKKYTQEVAEYRKNIDEVTKGHPIARSIGEIAPVALAGSLGAATALGRAAVSAGTFGLQRELTPLVPGETPEVRDKDALKTAAIAGVITLGAEKFIGFLSKNPAAAENKAANFIQDVTTKTTAKNTLADAQQTIKSVYEKSKMVNDKQWDIVRQTAIESNATVKTSPILEAVDLLKAEAEKSGGSQMETLTGVLKDTFKKIDLTTPSEHPYEFMWGLKQALNAEVKATKKAMVNGTKSGTEFRQLSVLSESVDKALEATSNPAVRELAKAAGQDLRMYVRPLQDARIQAAMLDEIAMTKLISNVWNGTGALSKAGPVSNKLSQGLSGASSEDSLKISRALIESHLKKAINSAGEFNPQQFAESWHKMPDQVKQMFFPGKIDAIDGFMKGISAYQKLPSIGMLASATGGVGFLSWLAGLGTGGTTAVVGTSLGVMAMRKMLDNPRTLNILKSAARIDAGTSSQVAQYFATAIGKEFNGLATRELKKLDPEFRFELFKASIPIQEESNPFLRE